MIVLCDNDIVLKLASFDLLEDVAALTENREVRVLDALRPQLLRSPKWRKKYGELALERALSFVENSQTITEAFDLEDSAALIDAHYDNAEGRECAIDGGELVLISHAFHNPDARLLTGDKRCLHALGCHRHHNARAQIIHASLANRVLCLEAAILWCIRHHGFETLRARVVPQLNCDEAMRAVFGSGMASQEGTVVSGLSHYMNNLEKTVGENWLWRP